MDRFMQLGMARGHRGVQDSGLASNRRQCRAHRRAYRLRHRRLYRPSRTTPAHTLKRVNAASPFISMTIINMVSGNLSILLGLKGPNLAMVTACATATHAIGDAGRIINAATPTP